ncbi:MAG: hypothetical protein L0K86_00650 [Actinomycetia bacterium]|nr:hypothetical protein [Actinomycetes bacterium]
MPEAADQPSVVRQLDTPGTRRLAGLAATFDSLQMVLRCCERLVTELAKPSDERDDLVVEGVWATAVLAYTRCFSDEVNDTHLSDDDVANTRLADQLMDSHKALRRLRDRYVDPVTKPHEQFTVGVAQDGDGRASGIAITATSLPPLDDLTVRQMGALAYELAQLIDDRVARQQEGVFAAAAELGQPELDKLPLVRIAAAETRE